jgi:hypothetical protein
VTIVDNFDGELVGCAIVGLWMMTGLVLAGRPGELWGLGGWHGLDVGAGLRGGLCERTPGRLRMTLAVPPPSKTPESSSRLEILSRVGSGGWIWMGVESGLGGFRTASDILGDEGLTRSGEDVLVSATDSPRSGQRHCLKANFADGCLL